MNYVYKSLSIPLSNIRVLKSYTAAAAVNVNTLMERRARVNREINEPYRSVRSRVTLRSKSGQQISLDTCMRNRD